MGTELTDTKPTGPRRGRPPSLSLEQIAEAAIELSNRESFDAMSMRALAGELGVPVMTIYNYVPNKAALFDLISDHLLRPIPIPGPEIGSWDVRMRQLQAATRAAAGRHSGIRLGTGIGQSSEAARLAEGVMEILADGGFNAEQAEMAFATLFTFMLGQIELDAIVTNGSAQTDPELRSIAPATGRDDVFEFGFDVVLEGLRARFDKDPGS